MYFSKNKYAESSLYSLDHPECASHCVLGDVPTPIHSSAVVVEIVQENALC